MGSEGDAGCAGEQVQGQRQDQGTHTLEQDASTPHRSSHFQLIWAVERDSKRQYERDREGESEREHCAKRDLRKKNSFQHFCVEKLFVDVVATFALCVCV